MKRREWVKGFSAAVAGSVLMGLGACSTGSSMRRAVAPEGLLASLPEPWLSRVADPAHQFRMQVTVFDPSRQRWPLGLHHERHGLDDRSWFAPGSWVKLPLALLAVERMEALGLGIGARIHLDTPPATGEWAADEAQAESLLRTIRRVFVISDNAAANRLYEFLGQDLIHDRLAALGYPNARLVSRIGSSDVSANRRSVAVRVVDAEGGTRFARAAVETAVARSFPHGEARSGFGWLEGDRVIAGAHDFSTSNFLALGDMHTMLLALITPEAVPVSQRWRISEAARLAVLTEMGHWPRESSDPSYSEAQYPDRYAKFLLPQGDANRWLRLYGKCGQAFGYLNDAQCVLDTRTGRQVLVSASIHVNADGIFNDDVYEYDDVGFPLLAGLGQAALDSA